MNAVQTLLMESSGLVLNDDAKVRPIILVTYIHGWKHNASDGDENVTRFRQTLERLGRQETWLAKRHDRYARKVVGIYVGWPGLQLDAGPLTNLSFYSRKNTSDRVGHNGGVAEVLARVEKLHDTIKGKLSAEQFTSSRSLSVTIGHSFGGQALFDAVLPVVTDRIVAERVQAEVEKQQKAYAVATGTTPRTASFEQPDKKIVNSYGDLVVLVNPAFQASRFFNLMKLAGAIQYDDDQRPVLALFGSDGDWATHYAFPLGRWISTLFENYRDDAGPSARFQGRTDRHTVLWIDEFVTHTLDRTKDRSPSGGWDVSKRSEPIVLGHSMLKRNEAPEVAGQPWTPIYVVKVSKELIKDHGDIWNVDFDDFLSRFIFYVTSDKPSGEDISHVEATDY
jgi:hypothetical protein